jgi:nitroimidazol reductase NimA-like FMN-containing flavoprotein (pyridoxamine 5'-phosphate oxidase superfamily)
MSQQLPLSAGFNLPDTVKAAVDPSFGMPGMRRKEKEITERAVIEEILREQEVGRLATSVGDQPYVVPINFVYIDGKIIFHSHKDGTKMANIAKNTKVCFEVDSGEMVKAEKPCDYSWRYMSVVVKGNVKIITNPAARLVALRRISDKYAPGKGKTLTADELAKNPQLVLAEIVIDEMTGKKSPVKPPV